MYNVALGIQARSDSTRLPGKIYEDLCGAPLLDRVIQTCQKVSVHGAKIKVVVLGPQGDDRLQEFVKERSIAYVSGSREDLILRYMKIFSVWEEIEAAIRVTSDCPFLPEHMIQEVIKGLMNGHDYCSNTFMRSFIEGFDCQGASYRGWEWVNDKQREEREHPWKEFDENAHIRKKFLDAGYKINGVLNQMNPIFTKTSIDTPQDLERARMMWGNLHAASGTSA